jgi:hypothetical protein
VSFLTRWAVSRCRRAFLVRERRDAIAVATHLRDASPFHADGNAAVIASGVYLSAGLVPDGPVREAVAALGGAEFWVEDHRGGEDLVHSVYVVTMTRAAHLASVAGKEGKS